MNEERINHLSLNAQYIETLEINNRIASDCQLRSKFVHEKILQSRNKDAAYSVTLVISENGVKIIRLLDQSPISSHAIHRISYSACDRINRLFALVVRATGLGKAQVCYLFRMDTPEQADSINRYFGAIFKDLHDRKKERKLQHSLTRAEITAKERDKYENMSEVVNSLTMHDPDSEFGHLRGCDNGEARLRQISTSNINDLVSEKHNIRRLSLCMMSTASDDVDVDEQSQPLHQSLEKTSTIGANNNSNNNARPLVRKKKPEYKGNRISAAIERWSFRGNRDLSSDFLKSGSPVVALKEQLEHEERLSAESSLGSEHRHEQSNNIGCIPHSQSKKQLLPSHSNLHINNDSKATNNIISNFVRKNSAPICNPFADEQPPVPPVRIHSLRNPTCAKTLAVTEPGHLVRGCGEGASQIIADYNDDSDELSSITTPSTSSSTRDQLEQLKFIIYNEPPPPSRTYREPPVKTQQNYSYAAKEVINSPAPISANYQTNVPMEYFRDFNKEEAMDYLLDKEIGGFLLRYSASHHRCLALSVKVADNLVSHYIIQQTSIGFQMKGLDKTWPNIPALITHLSVIPEMLPCPIRITQPCLDRKLTAPSTYFTSDLSKDLLPPSKYIYRQKLPQSQSANDEYQQRMKHFLSDVSPAHDQYQQLSDFSSIVASLDII